MERLELILPICYNTAFMYGDYSGLNEKEVQMIDNFVNEKLEKYDRFMCVNIKDDKRFRHRNDLNDLGAECCTYIFDIG